MSDISLDLRRRFYAEELDAVCSFRTAGLVDAFAAVPRERYLPPGPWSVLGLGDVTGIPGASMKPRVTPDSDPGRVYHNIGIAIDPARQLFNGHPSTLAAWIDAFDLKSGARVLHVGCGPGYYTAVMAHMVGPPGSVIAIDVDEPLANRARANLASMPWVTVMLGDASNLPAGPFDAILVNAGVTHPRTEWLDRLAAGGRLMVPLTVAMPIMGPTIGKGTMILVTREGATDFAARQAGFVAIYSAIGLRDETLGVDLGAAMKKTLLPALKRLRRDAHDPTDSCWFHTADACLSTS